MRGVSQRQFSVTLGAIRYRTKARVGLRGISRLPGPASAVVIMLYAALAAGGGRAEEAGQARAEVYQRVAAMRSLGRQDVFRPGLSASGQLSCASCHSPADAFGPPNALAVQLGGKDMRKAGPARRAVAAIFAGGAAIHRAFLRFRRRGRRQRRQRPDRRADLGRPGRPGRDQARIPLLSPFEMANAEPGGVRRGRRRLCGRPRGEFRRDLRRSGKPSTARSKPSRPIEQTPPSSIPTAANTTPTLPARPS